jgi:enoyl-CoA hydratase/carnithine racemase
VSELILCEEQDYIAILTLNRAAKHNAMSPDMLVAMRDHLQRLEAEGATRVLIIRGQGTKAFTSGYDIGHLPERQGNERLTQRHQPNAFSDMLVALRKFSAPVIAMIHGFCMGGGLELAATCDIRISADTGTFRMPPARLGVLYSGDGLLRFMNLIGVANTNEIFFTACTFDAERARDMGLVNHVVAAADLEQTTYDMARQIAHNAPLSVKHTKQVLGMVQSFQDFTRHQDEMQRLREFCMNSDDFQEGRRAFLEKRQPVFQGR